MHQQYKEKKEKLKDTTKVGILAKYGGEEYLEQVPKELLMGQTENYVEYSRTGQVIRGLEKAKAKSKYPEDGASSAYPCYSFSELTHFFRSLYQQPFRCMGLFLRLELWAMGVCMLSFHHTWIVLYWRSRNRGQQSI